ncbi:hypothetical protein [Pseudonocardia acidicola]|uniref:HEAT repeat domain-containing protein n=1 Tax=Pseudonocardia acidicola TaxID=2724939 RepID=A0ABX1SA21_9PSEU|nr:hypothetical protein [Pseudonocardia acidicola]NMH97407.1 hypothetical protein [Pseudonocardia acidicola]
MSADVARRVLGTSLSAPVDARLQAALRRLARVCDLAATTDETAPSWDAVVWHHGAQPPPGVPLVVWVAALRPDREPARSAAALLAPEIIPDERCVVLGRYPEYPQARPVLPFTRRRIRLARRLAGPACAGVVAGSWRWDGAEVPAGVEDAAAGLACSVIATDPVGALRALAWAAPTVTDPATAAALGAVDGEQVRVAGDAQGRRAAAAQLAGDERTAAALSWAGRRLYERRWSAEGVIERLPRSRGPADAADGLARALDALHTPADSAVRSRARDAVAALRGLP